MKLARNLIGFWKLHAPDDGGGGGGGDGGGDGGKGDPPPATNLSEDQKKEVANIVNQTITAHGKRGTFTAGVGDVMAAELEKRGFKPPGVDDPPKPKPDDGKGGKGDPDPDIAKLKGQIVALEKKNQESEKATATERGKNNEREERGKLREALTAGGVGDDRVRGAVADLYLDQKCVTRAEDGAVVMHMKRDGYEEDIPIADGVAEFLKSDAGKGYLPAKDAGGSNNRGGNAPPPKSGSKEEKKAAALDYVGNWMASGGRSGG
jgi:hypothetical protein